MLRRPLSLPLSLIAVLAAATLVGCSSGGAPAAPAAPPAAPSGPVDPMVQKAVDDYKVYVIGQIDEIVTKTKVLTDAVRAGNLPAAQAAYAPSRVPWERIEPIAGLVDVIDGKVDSRVDDFAGVDDPAFTGWHRLEYLMFAKNTTAGGAPFADQLDADLQTLKTEFPGVKIPPAAVATGASELIEEVSMGKITGEEDRYSKTDLWDVDGNLDGSKAVVVRLTPTLQKADPALLSAINGQFAELDATLAPMRAGDGWLLYCQENDKFPSARCPTVTVSAATVDKLKAQLAGLSEKTSTIAGVLNLG